MQKEMVKETLDRVDLAALLHLSPETIRADISRRPWMLPPYVKLGVKTVWLRATVMDWLKAREQSATPPVKQEPLHTPKRRGRPTKADQVLAHRTAAAQSASRLATRN